MQNTVIFAYFGSKIPQITLISQILNSKILVRRGGIFIAYVIDIPNALFWVASRKNTQKPANIIIPNNP
jgi:hypothetical protein